MLDLGLFDGFCRPFKVLHLICICYFCQLCQLRFVNTFTPCHLGIAVRLSVASITYRPPNITLAKRGKNRCKMTDIAIEMIMLPKKPINAAEVFPTVICFIAMPKHDSAIVCIRNIGKEDVVSH